MINDIETGKNGCDKLCSKISVEGPDLLIPIEKNLNMVVFYVTFTVSNIYACKKKLFSIYLIFYL